MTDIKELASCPFCGSRPIVFDSGAIKCMSRDCWGPIVENYDNPYDAIAAWNRRAIPPAPAESGAVAWTDDLIGAVYYLYQMKVREYDDDFRRLTKPEGFWKEKYGTNLHSTSLGEKWALKQAILAVNIPPPSAFMGRVTEALAAMAGNAPQVEYDDDGSYALHFGSDPMVTWDFNARGNVMVTCVYADSTKSFAFSPRAALDYHAPAPGDTQPALPSTAETLIETRWEEAGFVEVLNEDVPVVVREFPAPSAILLDVNTRKVVGYRVYDPAAIDSPPYHGGGEGRQSIETAPKDGTRILGQNAKGVSVMMWSEAEPISSDSPGLDAGWLSIDDGGAIPACPGFGSPEEMQPTIWQPLPALRSQP